MTFNSYIFILLFLPLALLGWYGLRSIKAYRLSLLFLTGMSLWFYGYFNITYLWIMVATIVCNHVLSLLLDRLPKSRIVSRLILIVGVLLNLGILFYFKYFDFLIENVNAIFHTGISLRGILLPLGISFFTFQQLSFIIDRATGKAEHYSLAEYSAFVTFFPQLVAGPIVLHSEMLPQFTDHSRKTFDSLMFYKGFISFVLGLAKKVLLADTLAIYVDYGYSNPELLDTFSTIYVILAYALEIYFDFSGYSDMAVGLGKMFGIELPTNFNSPYKSATIREFWTRWHITLNRFLVTYVYIPLGGNRKGQARKLLNIFIVFFLSGLWHGASWNYVIWGVINGIIVIWNNLNIVGYDDRTHPRLQMPRPIGVVITFIEFALSLVFFRSPDLTCVGQMCANLSKGWTGNMYRIASVIDVPELYVLKQAVTRLAPGIMEPVYLCLTIAFLLMGFYICSRRNVAEICDKYRDKAWMPLAVTLLLVYCIISFSGVSTFIYFNF